MPNPGGRGHLASSRTCLGTCCFVPVCLDRKRSMKEGKSSLSLLPKLCIGRAEISLLFPLTHLDPFLQVYPLNSCSSSQKGAPGLGNSLSFSKKVSHVGIPIPKAWVFFIAKDWFSYPITSWQSLLGLSILGKIPSREA